MESKERKARNFRLSMVDASSHERLWSLRFSQTTMIVAITSAVVIVIVGLFCIIAYTPIRTFIPGYPDAYSRRQAIQNAQRIDSLETSIIRWQLYSENLRRIVTGQEPIRMDSLILGSKGSSALPSAQFLELRDSLLRAFDATVHPWTDITAPAGTMVMSVLDGTVISTGWDQDKGYSIILQHKGDIISIYRNNQKLLHRVGDNVKAGTPVALLASSPSLTKGDHLHFELWYNGRPADPAEYISF